LKLILSAAYVLLSVAALADPNHPSLTADQLLANVVAQLPTKPINVSGELLVRRRRGVPIASFGFTLDANWGAKPPRATYTIRDAFGRSLEQLTITHGATTSYHHATGDPLKETQLSDLSLPIQKTDLSWVDLTLSFLWWPGGRLVGEESIRGFDCFIVEVNAPNPRTPEEEGRTPDRATIEASPLDSCPYTKARLWISKKVNMMLQAEGYDAEGDLERKLWVRNFKKINEQWMIKDMEVQHYPMVHRTKLRVVDVTHTTGESQAAVATHEATSLEPSTADASP
jgi:hypothetical protein